MSKKSKSPANPLADQGLGFRFPEIQKHMDMALSTPVGIRIKFQNNSALRSFTARFSRRKSDWKKLYLATFGGLTKTPTEAPQLINLPDEFVEQLMAEGYTEYATTKRFYWQSPYEGLATRLDPEDDSVLYVYNTWTSQGFDTAVLEVEVLEEDFNIG